MPALSSNLRLSNPSVAWMVHCLVVDGGIMIVCIYGFEVRSRLWYQLTTKACIELDIE